MDKFTFYNPTKIYFGENSLENLEDEILNKYKNILLVYGGGSIKKEGIYDEVIKILNKLNINIYELSQVLPNPSLEKVYEGINICKENKVEFILAIGGGSVIDCAKAISVGALTTKDVWRNFYVEKLECECALPIGTILTCIGTGSEMNNDSVITNYETKEKLNYPSDKTYPKFSILDPKYTFSLSPNQTVYGAIDILAHVFEQYFSYPDELNLSDHISEKIMKFVIDNLHVVLDNPTDYTSRSNLMWASTMALNNIIGLGKEQDWSSHNIGHALSTLYNLPHGATLSIIFPGWMKYVYKESLEKFKRYAIEIWKIEEKNKTDDEIALDGIIATKEFFKKYGAPVSLNDIGVTEDDFDKIIKVIDIDNAGSYIKITENDIKEILKNCI